LPSIDLKFANGLVRRRSEDPSLIVSAIADPQESFILPWQAVSLIFIWL
jgi:hypothetical protein